MANGILSYDTHLHAMDSPLTSNIGKRSTPEAVRDPNNGPPDITADQAIPSPRSFDKRRKLDSLSLPAPGGGGGGQERTLLDGKFLTCSFSFMMAVQI